MTKHLIELKLVHVCPLCQVKTVIKHWNIIKRQCLDIDTYQSYIYIIHVRKRRERMITYCSGLDYSLGSDVIKSEQNMKPVTDEEEKKKNQKISNKNDIVNNQQNSNRIYFIYSCSLFSMWFNFNKFLCLLSIILSSK